MKIFHNRSSYTLPWGRTRAFHSLFRPPVLIANGLALPLRQAPYETLQALYDLHGQGKDTPCDFAITPGTRPQLLLWPCPDKNYQLELVYFPRPISV